MSLKYESYHPRPGADLGLCGLCRDDLSNGQLIVAHEGSGALHPVHKGCIKSAGAWRAHCPSCFSPTDSNSLITFNERVVGKIQTKLRHGAVGVYETGKAIAIGGVVGALFGAVYGSVVMGASIGVQLTCLVCIQRPVVDLVKTLRVHDRVVNCAEVGGLALSLLLMVKGPKICLTAVVISGVIAGLLNPNLHPVSREI